MPFGKKLVLSNGKDITSKEAVISVKYVDHLTGECKIKYLVLPEDAIVNFHYEEILLERDFGDMSPSCILADPAIGKIVIYIKKDKNAQVTEAVGQELTEEDIRKIKYEQS